MSAPAGEPWTLMTPEQVRESRTLEYRQLVRALTVEARAASMLMTVHASRDDRRIAGRHEGPDGWAWAYHRFDVAMSALEALQGWDALDESLVAAQ